MSFDPTWDDHGALDAFLGRVLDAYKDGEIDRDRAAGLLAHVITAAAIDNEREFERFIRQPTERHLED